ncbi:MAG TPA: hypothetical protein VKV57_12165 [bacterium]|nr:hypothetical protein [bacterium]
MQFALPGFHLRVVAVVRVGSTTALITGFCDTSSGIIEADGACYRRAQVVTIRHAPNGDGGSRLPLGEVTQSMVLLLAMGGMSGRDLMKWARVGCGPWQEIPVGLRPSPEGSAEPLSVDSGSGAQRAPALADR